MRAGRLPEIFGIITIGKNFMNTIFIYYFIFIFCIIPLIYAAIKYIQMERELTKLDVRDGTTDDIIPRRIAVFLIFGYLIGGLIVATVQRLAHHMLLHAIIVGAISIWSAIHKKKFKFGHFILLTVSILEFALYYMIKNVI